MPCKAKKACLVSEDENPGEPEEATQPKIDTVLPTTPYCQGIIEGGVGFVGVGKRSPVGLFISSKAR